MDYCTSLSDRHSELVARRVACSSEAEKRLRARLFCSPLVEALGKPIENGLPERRSSTTKTLSSRRQTSWGRPTETENNR